MTTIAIPHTVPSQKPGLVSQINAEWTKLRSVRAFYIQVGLATLVAIGMSALICFAIISNWDTEQAVTFQPVATSLIGLVFSGLVLAVTGVTLVASEYTSGMIRLTMAVTPSRLRVLLAKAIVI